MDKKYTIAVAGMWYIRRAIDKLLSSHAASINYFF